MIDDISADASSRMDKSIEALRHEFSKIRTGRAHTSLLDHVTVDYYGSDVPISQVANLSVEDARTLTVTPWEKTMVPVVEKAILKSDLGLNPSTAGQVIRIMIPLLTEERRKDLVKVVRNEAEGARIAVRNIRRDANQSLKDLEKEKELSEDDLRRGEQIIQTLTDKKIASIDELLTDKETELMVV